MNTFDDLIESATRRLRPDPELRQEVARELRGHLEDAADGARARGCAEDDAQQEALRSFGDADALADRLWQANRRRMRLRAVARWAGRIVLVPLTVLVALWLALGTLDFTEFMGLCGQVGGAAPLSFPHYLNPGLRDHTLRPRAGLSDEDRFVNEHRTGAAGAREIVDHYPNNTLYRAHRATMRLSHPNKSGTFSPTDLAEVLAQLDAGERLDPDNAYWNYMKAAAHIFLSGAATDEEDESFAYTRRWRDGTVKRVYGFRLSITDALSFEQGMVEYRKGLAKPRYDSYNMTFAAHILSLNKKPTTLVGEMAAVAITAGALLPDLARMRQLTRCATARARQLAREGHRDEAEILLRTAPVPASQMAMNSRSLIELMVAANMRQAALREGAVVYEQLGATAKAAKCRDLAELDQDRFNSLFGDSAYQRLVLDRGAILSGILLPGIRLTDLAILDDVRLAERALVESAALGLVALAFLAVITWVGAAVLFALWRHRKDARGPRLYFVGWRRLGLVLVVAVAMPLTAYWAFTRLTPFASVNYGLNVTTIQTLAEMAVAGLTILVLSIVVGAWAVRARCRAVKLDDPVQLRQTRRRCLIPVLAVCMLTVGLISHTYVRWNEYRHISALQQPGRRLFLDEVDYTSAAQYRDYLRSLPHHGALE